MATLHIFRNQHMYFFTKGTFIAGEHKKSFTKKNYDLTQTFWTVFCFGWHFGIFFIIFFLHSVEHDYNKYFPVNSDFQWFLYLYNSSIVLFCQQGLVHPIFEKKWYSVFMLFVYVCVRILMVTIHCCCMAVSRSDIVLNFYFGVLQNKVSYVRNNMRNWLECSVIEWTIPLSGIRLYTVPSS